MNIKTLVAAFFMGATIAGTTDVEARNSRHDTHDTGKSTNDKKASDGTGGVFQKYTGSVRPDEQAPDKDDPIRPPSRDKDGKKDVHVAPDKRDPIYPPGYDKDGKKDVSIAPDKRDPIYPPRYGKDGKKEKTIEDRQDTFKAATSNESKESKVASEQTSKGVPTLKEWLQKLDM